MKYSLNVIINSSLEKVTDLYKDQSNNDKWQEGCVSIKYLNGNREKVGDKTELVFETGKRKMMMTETIVETNFPHKYVVTYEAKGVFNTVITEFEKIEENKTLLKTENEFKFKGFMVLFGLLMPGAFKKQTMKYMNRFKAFAEKELIA